MHFLELFLSNHIPLDVFSCQITYPLMFFVFFSLFKTLNISFFWGFLSNHIPLDVVGSLKLGYRVCFSMCLSNRIPQSVLITFFTYFEVSCQITYPILSKYYTIRVRIHRFCAEYNAIRVRIHTPKMLKTFCYRVLSSVLND